MRKKLGIFFIVIAILSVVFSYFFKDHLVSDAYRIINNSNEYMINLKLIEGRPIQALYFKVLSILGIGINSISEYLFLYRINLSISIIILSISFCIVYNTFVKSLKLEKNKQKMLLFVITLTIFVNISICEYMLFIENFVISLGILFSIVATIIFYSNKKYKYVYSIILLLISSFCYQGVAQFFVIFSFIIFLIKYKESNKQIYFITILKILIVYLFAQSINYFICFCFNNYLPNLDPRLFNGVINNLDKIISYDNITICKIYAITIFITICLNIKILYERKFFVHVVNIIILVLLSIFAFAIFLFNNSCGLMPRTVFNFIVIFPIITIYILSVNKEKNVNLYLVLTCLLLICNVKFVIKLQKYNIASTQQNIEVVNNIIEKINKYEIENNIKVDAIMFYNDKNINYEYWNAYRTIYSTYNNPIYYGYWCDIYSINVLSGRNFDKVNDENCDKKLFDYFKSNNWDEPNLDEQLIFNKNIVSICRF